MVTKALTPPCASPSDASSGSPDSRALHTDQLVRVRRPHGFAEATFVQIDPSIGLLELQPLDEACSVKREGAKLPAEKVFAAVG